MKPLYSYIVSEKNMTLALSQLSHDIKYCENEEHVMRMLQTEPSELQDCSDVYRIAVVTIVEQFFLNIRKEPPPWIFGEHYYSKTIIYSPSVLKIAGKVKNADEFLNKVKDTASPLCLRRGLAASEPLEVF